MKKKKKKSKSFLLKIFNFILIIVTAIVLYIIISGYIMYKNAVDSVSIEQKITQIKSSSYYTSKEDIPDTYKKATVATEDHRFYEHGAIDVISIGRAVITDISTLSLKEGGSTITQQLAKNMYFSQERKFERKIAEVFVAIDLEKNYSKDDILEYYLNVIYFGDGLTGIGQASKGYFNKLPSELTLYEQTLLVGIPNAPSAYALSSNSTLAEERQNYVLDAMVTYNYITKEEAENVKENVN